MYRTVIKFLQIPLVALSKASVCGRSFGESAGSNPAGAWTTASCVCCVMSGRGLCDELITRPEESYWV